MPRLKDSRPGLFAGAQQQPEIRPLAERVRPAEFEDLVGQDKVAGPNGVLTELLKAGGLTSVVFWGPPGCGKTTLARLLATKVNARFVPFSAVLGGVPEVRTLIARAEELLLASAQRTLLFVDEIHRFSKSQQDAFLPHVERGTITLVGATTENPSFYLNSALLSRMTVVRLSPLAQADLVKLLERCLSHPNGLCNRVQATPDALEVLAGLADGDARRGITLLEQCSAVAVANEGMIDRELVTRIATSQPLRHDRSGDSHYDVVSAFIKSMRGSDPDASLYWAARLLHAGEDPLFLARRMVIFASEDVGNADPRAISLAVGVLEAVRFLGMPEARIPLAQGITYLATASKSNAAYKAMDKALDLQDKLGSPPVPLHLRNAPTKLLEELGAGQGYLYPHDFPGATARQNYLPDEFPKDLNLYVPSDSGYEKHIREMIEWRARLLETSEGKKRD